MISTAVIIALLWEKFQTNPTITGLDTDFHDWNVSFPAITLCMSNPYNKNLTDELSRNEDISQLSEMLNEDSCKILNRTGDQHDSSGLDCFSQILIHLAEISYGNIDVFKEYTDSTLQDKNLRNICMKIYSHCEDIFKDCSWKGKEQGSCCFPNNPNGLKPLFTDHGFCYAFNSQKTEDIWPWISTVMKGGSTLEIYETDDSWEFSFNVKDSIYFPIKVFIHDAMEVPAAEIQPQHEWDGRISQLVFSAKTTYTTLGARQLSIGQRHCVFPDELQLQLDPEGYTYSGCLRQCHADEAMRLCGCVPPFVNEIGHYKHCDLSGLACLAENREQLIHCQSLSCELGCLNTVYEVEKLSGSLLHEQYKPLHIGFVSWPMVRYKREVLFGWVDLFVSFGGIAGLFLGFSLLSGVEIIYYLTLRVLCMVVLPSNLKRKKCAKSKRGPKSIGLKK
ncbi:sodium channel protein Nach-like [Ischnura elegans]|uniref:sodium channel protein Nach-like n=1 Tax=Ischnura elegans TaxID=197161 RepID=UPI001ED894AE|nr:sodium channel protein Nach-like [Ischnura elegans]